MLNVFLVLFSSFLILLIIYFYHLLFFNVSSYYHNQLVWSSSFECGFSGHCININNFSVSFFVLLVFFVVFDLEISLLLNLPLQPCLFKNFFFYLFFIILISIGYLLEIGKGFVNWQN
uniref:NADH-ubiquinone oxidoreductase chain 3 n=1 Tax=Benedenia seriolae TaxID=160838 RepID=A0A499VPY2_BENSE|nr:NADH dehydrogenase subunit 3 [Benedenia seriolae]BBJ70621.1 NADH dehydrogenase subunit 3 [Benedenia seriolae]BBJ70633.1 NADH dehydrogenase subunit 3 [Benedenia seriolae]BBJ70645.1 NADH dehydrogenase subunit 3 [Benedenia seriolae]BBJ70657.1 NADH dehydrogenase subunit 3 [Benedenia seriolae]